MANEKKCTNCGATLAADAVFCGSCGTKQEAVATVETVETVENNGGATESGFSLSDANVKKYVPLIGIGLAVIAVIIIAIAVVTSLTKWTKIDPSDICRVQFSGVNEYGEAEVFFAFDEKTTFYLTSIARYEEDFSNQDAVKALSRMDIDDIEDYLEESDVSDEDLEKYFEDKDLKVSDFVSLDEDTLLDAFEKAKDEDEALEMRDAIFDGVEFKLADKKLNGKLKNGDKIKIKVEYDEDDLKDANIKLTCDEFEVTVEGLVDAEELDVLKDVKFNFEGTDGNGSFSVNRDDCSDFIKDNFGLNYDYRYDLKNGDKIKVTVNYYGYDYDEDLGGVFYTEKTDDKTEEKFYKFEKEFETEITVSGLKELQEVDVFQYLNISYSGIAPNLSIKYEWMDTTPEYVKDYVSISNDAYSVDIVDGAKVTFSAYAYSGFATEGYKLKSETYEFIVDMSKAPAYLKPDDLKNGNDKELADAFDAYVQTEDFQNRVIGYYTTDGRIESIKSANYKYGYLKSNKNQDPWYTQNYYKRVYQVELEYDEGKTGKAFLVLTIYDVTVTEGKINVPFELDCELSIHMSEDEIEGIHGTEDENYTVYKF